MDTRHSASAAHQELYQISLLYKLVGVLAKVVDDCLGCRAAIGGLRFAGYQEGIHEGLRVMVPYSHKEIVDEPLNHHLICVDPSYHLPDIPMNHFLLSRPRWYQLYKIRQV